MCVREREIDDREEREREGPEKELENHVRAIEKEQYTNISTIASTITFIHPHLQLHYLCIFDGYVSDISKEEHIVLHE